MDGLILVHKSTMNLQTALKKKYRKSPLETGASAGLYDVNDEVDMNEVEPVSSTTVLEEEKLQ